jgi:putative transposase
MYPEDFAAHELPYHLFEPESDIHAVQRRLPHWSQPGAVAFITWRQNDSMPKEVVDRWRQERDQWLRDHNIEPRDPNCPALLKKHDPQLWHTTLRTFSLRWHDALDSGHGSCVMRDFNIANIVADSLHYFDGDRYMLLDFVIMPNHVHLLAAFPDEEGMLKQCESWKHFTATQINRALKRKERFWQQEAFDHLVRSEEQLQYLRQYIAQNPEKARLKPGEYIHYSSPARL